LGAKGKAQEEKGSRLAENDPEKGHEGCGVGKKKTILKGGETI